MFLELRPGYFINPAEVSMVSRGDLRDVQLVMKTGHSLSVDLQDGEQWEAGARRIARLIEEAAKPKQTISFEVDKK